MEFESLLSLLECFFTEREKNILIDRLGISGIEFAKKDRELKIAEVYRKYNLMLAPSSEICLKHNISRAKLKLIEALFLQKSGLYRKKHMAVLRGFIAEA